MIDIKAIREAAEAATPGPWVHGSDGRKELNNVSHFIEDCVPKWNRSLKEHLPALIVYGVNRAEDAAHIATANPATVLALCDEIERLQKEVERLQAAASDPQLLTSNERRAVGERILMHIKHGTEYVK